jgi:HK97 family phage major capsid protein
MIDYDKIRCDIARLRGAAAELDAHAALQGRSLSADELKIKRDLLKEAENLSLELPSSGPLTLQGITDPYGQRVASSEGYELRAPGQAKDYRSLFGTRSDGYTWKDRSTDYFSAVMSGRHHPDLITRSMNETTPSDGGFLVPTEYAQQIHAVSLENELVMPRCFVQPMKSNECHIPAMAIGSHSTSLYGGFTASYTDEAGTINEANPKTRSMTLNAKKLTGLIRLSNELVSDLPGGPDQIIQICGKGLSWYRDKAFLKGSGVGQPLGILNSSCLISVAAEDGQPADTICYENLVNMFARMYSGGFKNSCWVVHQTCLPQLLTLSITIGVGGDHIPVMREDGSGGYTILTRPVLITEKTEPLGDVGDIIFADLSQYVAGLRAGMRFDMSPHVHFSTDETLVRLVERHDGQPLWSEALTLEDGVTTVSPFIVLAAR